jgi:hypothetical protein
LDLARGESVKQFSDEIRKAPIESYPSLRLGKNLCLQDPFVSGAALVHEEEVLNMTAFSHDGNKSDGEKIPFQGFSQRKRRSKEVPGS